MDYITDLVGTLTAGNTNDYDRVRALFDYFSAANGFSYNLSTKEGTSGSDIVDFLQKKVGYCEQYASALAWLVRAAGIPARVALGFTRGSNRQGQTYTLNNTNLHAWTEVYFAGYGWVPFDATPASRIGGSVSPEWAPDPDRPTQAPTVRPERLGRRPRRHRRPRLNQQPEPAGLRRRGYRQRRRPGRRSVVELAVVAAGLGGGAVGAARDADAAPCLDAPTPTGRAPVPSSGGGTRHRRADRRQR